MKNPCIGCGTAIYECGTADPCLCRMCEQTIVEGKTHARLYVL